MMSVPTCEFSRVPSKHLVDESSLVHFHRLVMPTLPLRLRHNGPTMKSSKVSFVCLSLEAIVHAPTNL